VNGARHYLEAEKLLAACQLHEVGRHPEDSELYPARPGADGVDAESHALAAAQVHAALALVAAQVTAAAVAAGSVALLSEWSGVLS
jgi:hypothetical protein